MCTIKVGELYDMCLYTKNAVNLISLIITIIIFFIFNQINLKNINFENIEFLKSTKNSTSENIIQENITNENIISNSESKSEDINSIESINIIENDSISKEKETNIEYEWAINIPIINLTAPIEESISKEVMNRSVGHFENTSKWDGNIGLGAHNRGYKVNYFANIKKLKKGDIINYIYNGKTRQYIVTNIVIIKDTDWSYLEKTEENKITLITCVENEPNYRRCIQGTEK